jgi:hypothetical protein
VYAVAAAGVVLAAAAPAGGAGGPSVAAGTAKAAPYLNVWVHYDYMVGRGHSDEPSAGAIQIVVDAFKAHGVTLHVDPQHTAIPRHDVIVPDWPGLYASARNPGFDNPDCTGADAVLFSDLKAQYFHPKSNQPWHYAIFGDYVFGDPAHVANCPSTLENANQPPQPGMTGDSQVGFLDVQGGLGYDFVVALQGLRDAGIDPATLAGADAARIEAAMFMHELGHNLGLCHSGPDFPAQACLSGSWGHDPNYPSVMNPSFNFGIPYAATPGSTVIAGYRVDYSDVALPPLDESSLDETVGVQDTVHPTDLTKEYGRSTLLPVVGPIDWNGDGTSTDTSAQHDLNGDQALTVLLGADDWEWIHSRLTPPSVTGFSTSSVSVADTILISGVNLMMPATVFFAGGVSAAATELASYDLSPRTSIVVTVPPAARSGPITVATPDGTTTSSQPLTVTP